MFSFTSNANFLSLAILFTAFINGLYQRAKKDYTIPYKFILSLQMYNLCSRFCSRKHSCIQSIQRWVSIHIGLKITILPSLSRLSLVSGHHQLPKHYPNAQYHAWSSKGYWPFQQLSCVANMIYIDSCNEITQ